MCVYVYIYIYKILHIYIQISLPPPTCPPHTRSMGDIYENQSFVHDTKKNYFTT